MAVGYGNYTQATQIGSKTCFAQLHHAGDAVLVLTTDLNGNLVTGTVTTQEGDVEVIWPDGTREVWAAIDFNAQYQ